MPMSPWTQATVSPGNARSIELKVLRACSRLGPVFWTQEGRKKEKEKEKETRDKNRKKSEDEKKRGGEKGIYDTDVETRRQIKR